MRRYHDEISNETSDKVSDKKKKKLSGDGNHNDFIGGYLVHTDLLLIVTTLKSPKEATASPLALPKVLMVENYVTAWQNMQFPRAFGNTLLYYGNGGFFIVIFASMAGYALARTKTKWGMRFFLFFLAGLIVPFQMNIVSLYKIVKSFHLMNNAFAVILVNVAINTPQGVFLFKEFIESTIPRELEEAAEIDGCSVMKSFFHSASFAKAGDFYGGHHCDVKCLE